MSGRPKGMISYASEDKDFARQLRDGLQPFCEVWFDEDQLKVGDSLFEQINRGLGQSEFAVVVLSPHYTAKKWTNNELAGFIALEERTRKIVLPVWKDITREQVAAFSSILVDRVAAKASDGLPIVIAQLRSAIETAKRAVELATRPAAADRLKAFGVQRHTQAQIQARLETTEGVAEVKAGYRKLLDDLEAALQQAQSDGLKFNIKRQSDMLTAHTRDRLSLSVIFRPYYLNSLREAPLRIGVFKRGDEFTRMAEPGSREAENRLLDELEFDGWLENGEVVWRASERKVCTAEQVVEQALDLLLRTLHRESRE